MNIPELPKNIESHPDMTKDELVDSLKKMLEWYKEAEKELVKNMQEDGIPTDQLCPKNQGSLDFVI